MFKLNALSCCYTVEPLFKFYSPSLVGTSFELCREYADKPECHGGKLTFFFQIIKRFPTIPKPDFIPVISECTKWLKRNGWPRRSECRSNKNNSLYDKLCPAPTTTTPPPPPPPPPKPPPPPPPPTTTPTPTTPPHPLPQHTFCRWQIQKHFLPLNYFNLI